MTQRRKSVMKKPIPKSGHYMKRCWVCGNEIYGTDISISRHVQNCGKGSKQYRDIPVVRGE